MNVLTSCLITCAPSSSQSKASFETKTSAINLTPSTKSRYDIKQIKEDTLWLSKEAKIDEISSLRIAILEYQRRGIAHLLEEPSDRHSNPFSSDARRRLRLFQIYLEERLYTLRVVHLVLRTGAPAASPALDDHDTNDITTEPQWRTDLGQRIRASWGLLGENQQQKSSWVEKAVSALSSRINAVFESQNWSVDDVSKTELDVLWCQTHLLEMIQISQILLECIKSTSRIPRSHSIISWFRFMKQYAFFESSELVSRFL